jgi:hypothetical protein
MHTSIQVSRVYAYDWSAGNPPGYEWVLMDKVGNTSSLLDV